MTPLRPCLDGPTPAGHRRRTCPRCRSYWARLRGDQRDHVARGRRRRKQAFLQWLIRPHEPFLDWSTLT